MTRAVFNLAKRLRLSFDRPIAPEFTDASLLTRFLDRRDESAFTRLLERHAGLVWGVCRRGLTNHVDAEDAFQATFLVLFQQAGRIRKQQSLASWLHGVAWRITRKMKRSQQRRQRREQLLAVNEAKNGELAVDHALSEVVDAELARMPMRYREPILLCYLHGQSQAAAAQTLGWPVGTVAGRLSRAKELLRSRLIRRGVVPAIAANFAIELAQAEAPAQLLEKTLRTIQIGGTPTVLLLAKGMVGTMLITKWLMAGVVGVGLTLAAGVGYSTWQERKDTQDQNGNISSLSEEKRDHPDYQLIQGHWRWESGGDGILQEDLIFEGKTFIHKKKLGTGPVNVTKPDLFELHPRSEPKRLVLYSTYQLKTLEDTQKQFGGWGAAADLQTLGEERRLCTYEIKDDQLTIRTTWPKRGFVPYKQGNNGKVFADQNDPRAVFPKPDDPNVNLKVYRRVLDDKVDLSDYQKIQGHWRREVVDPRGGSMEREELAFEDKQYVLSVDRERVSFNKAKPAQFELDSQKKRMILYSPASELEAAKKRGELLGSFDKNNLGKERQLCTYELKENQLTIRYGGFVPYKLSDEGKIYADQQDPRAIYPQGEDSQFITKVYHRVVSSNNANRSNDMPGPPSVRKDEKKVLDDLITAADERVVLQFQAYKSGKESLNLVLDSIKDRVAIKLDKAASDQEQSLAALKEAFDSATEMGNIAEAKYKAGSATKLDVVTAKAARLDYELRLLRLEKSQLEKQPK